VLDIARDGDVVMCMGAGSIGGVPAKLVEVGRRCMSAVDVKAIGKVAVLMGGGRPSARCR
jgi:hypothetical protein